MAGLSAAIGLMVVLALSTVHSLDAEDMSDHLWRHELKKTFCDAIESYRIYKMERLDIHCAGKVGFFEDERVRIEC